MTIYRAGLVGCGRIGTLWETDPPTPVTHAGALAVLPQTQLVAGSSRGRAHLDHFGKQWERLRKRIGLSHVRLHDFRHFHGTELASAGVPMTVVRDRLRHSNLRTTSMYAHGRRALDRAAADAIGATLRVRSKEA